MVLRALLHGIISDFSYIENCQNVNECETDNGGCFGSLGDGLATTATCIDKTADPQLYNTEDYVTHSCSCPSGHYGNAVKIDQNGPYSYFATGTGCTKIPEPYGLDSQNSPYNCADSNLLPGYEGSITWNASDNVWLIEDVRMLMNVLKKFVNKNYDIFKEFNCGLFLGC